MGDDNVVYRIGQLEKDVLGIKEDMRLVLENHLPHIRADIAVLSTKARAILWVISVVGTILIGIGIAGLL